MKISIRLLCLICALVCISGCDSDVSVPLYRLKLPEMPPSWEIIPGQPRWKIEWQDTEGRNQALDVRGGETPEISLLNTRINAVIAWPYWPELAVNPGVFMPAGGLFPFDAAEGTLSLSWKGGVDAILYRELGFAAAADSGADRAGVPRLPWNFNWPRFRGLSDDEGVNAAFRENPWLADWPGIAAKIWQSGFDKRRLVPQARKETRVPLSPDIAGGPWIGTSPFAAPLVFDGVPVFPVRQATAASPPVDTWVSERGILRCTTETWFFHAWK